MVDVVLTLSSVPPELLGWALLSLVCSPLLIPFLMTRPRTIRARHRPVRRPWLLARLDESSPARPVATTTDPLALLGFVDRAGPQVFDVEADPLLPWAGPAPRGQHLTDAEVVAVAAGLNGRRPWAEQVDEIRLLGLPRDEAIDRIAALANLTRDGAADLLDSRTPAVERWGDPARWSATPNADDVEGWLADLTRRNHP